MLPNFLRDQVPASGQYIIDFEMLVTGKDRNNNRNPSSIIRASVLGLAEGSICETFNLVPDLYVSPKVAEDTHNLLGLTKNDYSDGLTFTEFIQKLHLIIPEDSPLVCIWGDYDEEVFRQQLGRNKINSHIRFFDIQEQVCNYIYNHGAMRFMYPKEGMRLGLYNVYNAFYNEEVSSTHNTEDDCVILKKLIHMLLFNTKRYPQELFLGILLQLLYKHREEKIKRYISTEVEINMNNVGRSKNYHVSIPSDSYTHDFSNVKEFLQKAAHKQNRFLDYPIE